MVSEENKVAVENIIQTLKNIEVDGETMQYIVEQTGLSDQIFRQLFFVTSPETVNSLLEERKDIFSKTNLTLDEKENIFLNILCNGALSEMESHGIVLDYKVEDYVDAKLKLNDPCYEDVLLKILKDGNSLTFIDDEGSEYTKSITMEDVYSMCERVPANLIYQHFNEEDDAESGDMFLQYLLYGEVIFG